MRKIILSLLFIPFNGFSQHQIQLNVDLQVNSDDENKIIFENYKKQPLYSSHVREFISDEIGKMKTNTKDNSLIASYVSYIEALKKTKTIEAVKVNLENAPKELLRKFYVDTDKPANTTTIYHRKNMGNQLQLTMQIYKEKAIMLLKTYFSGAESVTLTINNEKYKYPLKDTKRIMIPNYVFHNNDGNYMDENLYVIIDKIASAKGTIEIQFTGNNKKNTYFNLDSSSQLAIKETFYLYNIIKEY